MTYDRGLPILSSYCCRLLTVGGCFGFLVVTAKSAKVSQRTAKERQDVFFAFPLRFYLRALRLNVVGCLF